MFKNIKKGFTIVELVIVIAVIAILAGVLIPTFSSVTKNAKQSAAMQQAKNAMESTLALTGGSYTEGTDFVVAEGNNKKVDYWFSYDGNKLKDVTGKEGKDGAQADPYDKDENKKEYYAVYFSTKCFPTKDGKITSENANSKTEYQQSLAILLDALDIDAEVYTNNNLEAKDGYIKLTLTKPETESVDVKTIHIYYTPDIEPTLVIILGANN